MFLQDYLNVIWWFENMGKRIRILENNLLDVKTFDEILQILPKRRSIYISKQEDSILEIRRYNGKLEVWPYQGMPTKTRDKLVIVNEVNRLLIQYEYK